MAKTRILVADGADIDLTGIVTILNGSKSFEVVATATTMDEACKYYTKHKPDILLLSTNLKSFNINELMKNIQDADKDANVVVLAQEADIKELNQALRAGVSGYLLKNIEKRELLACIRNAVEEENIFSSSVTKLMSSQYANLTQHGSEKEMSGLITKREREVLQFIVDGYTSQEIAKMLYISPRTVETHRSNLLQKLNMKNTAALVRYALEEEEIIKSD